MIEAIEKGLVPALAALGEAGGEFDAGSFVTFLAGTPQALETFAQQTGSAAGAAGQFFGAVAGLVRAALRELGDRFRGFNDEVQRFQEGGIENETIQNFIQTLSAGVEPAQALEAGAGGPGTRDVSELTIRLVLEYSPTKSVAMAEAAGGGRRGYVRFGWDSWKRRGLEAGFSAEGVEISAEALPSPARDAASELLRRRSRPRRDAFAAIGGEGSAEAVTAAARSVTPDLPASVKVVEGAALPRGRGPHRDSVRPTA
ncbi:MAG: hypothetical protein U5Q03_14895 [Bacteroidota bacterium]|nr:hypothetical protein [Bacteroidota bacterium]